MSYTPNWTTKVFTIPVGDLTFVSGVNYTLDAGDFWIEVRRLEASAANNGGLYAKQALEFINTQTLSGIPYSAIVKLINGYTWEVDSSNIIVSLLGKNNNLLDTFAPANGVSVLANNSAGKITVDSGTSGLTAAEAADLSHSVELQEADHKYDKDTGLLHYYRKGTEVDLIPAKVVTGTTAQNTVTEKEPP